MRKKKYQGGMIRDTKMNAYTLPKRPFMGPTFKAVIGPGGRNLRKKLAGKMFQGMSKARIHTVV